MDSLFNNIIIKYNYDYFIVLYSNRPIYNSSDYLVFALIKLH